MIVSESLVEILPRESIIIFCLILRILFMLRFELLPLTSTFTRYFPPCPPHAELFGPDNMQRCRALIWIYTDPLDTGQDFANKKIGL